MVSPIFIAFGILFAVLLYAAKKRVQRQRACFDLYAVRDELVCLVAEGRLHEDSVVFRHFYQRINDYLVSSPNVGYDDLLVKLLSLRPDNDLDKSFVAARRSIAKVAASPEMGDPEVKRVVASYFDAVKRMTVAHSSLSRYLFISLMHATRLMPLWQWLAPRLWRMLSVAKFAEDRSAELAPEGG